MLTGGEPLMHSNLWRLCDELKALGARITLVTTGVALEANARQVAGACDEVVVSLDGDRDVHDRIRRVRGGFDRVAAGIAALRACGTMRIAARSVVQRLNYASLPETIAAAAAIGMDRISFLAADVSSPAFNRATPWDEARRAEVALGRDDLAPFAEAIRRALRERAADFASGFVAERPEGLWRLHRYYTALAGDGPWPAVRCNAPWISAVVDPDGAVRPCFFHPPYGSWQDAALDTLLNTDAAVRFRRELDVARDGTCSRCVCTMKLPITGRV
jgi:MoaA/NifB/PqqE/SkfB family radical SAM enzyme